MVSRPILQRGQRFTNDIEFVTHSPRAKAFVFNRQPGSITSTLPRNRPLRAPFVDATGRHPCQRGRHLPFHPRRSTRALQNTGPRRFQVARRFLQQPRSSRPATFMQPETGPTSTYRFKN